MNNRPSPRLTRRTFLGASAAAGLAPLVIRSRALGAEGAPSASERVALGIIGCGSRGTADLKGLTSQGAQCVAACDCYRDRREQIAQRFGAKPYADFRDLLARDDIDAVLIASPEHWHALMCVEACRHGKDVFCEKPLTLTIREAQAVLAAARRSDRVFQTGTQQRSDPRFRFACELVRNGYIGEVKSVFAEPGGTSKWCNLPGQPVPAGLDWEMWLGPAAWAPYHRDRCVDLWHWWNWREYSGGLMTDRGAHDYDIVQWGLGMDGSGPVEVYPPGTGGFKMLTYRYANGVLLESSDGGWGSSSRRSALVVFKGSKGTVSVWRGGLETDPPALAEVQLKPDEVHLYDSRNHYGNFVECVRSRRPCVADAQIGASSVNVCHIGNIARWVGRPVRWDPAAQEFLGDEEAGRHAWRPMREPWQLTI